MRHPVAAILAACLLLPTMSIASETENPALALIEISAGSAAISVTASVLALSNAELRAELVVERSGAAGTASLRQAGSFALAAGERVAFGQLNISFAPGDAFLATATVWRGDRIVATAQTKTEPEDR